MKENNLTKLSNLAIYWMVAGFFFLLGARASDEWLRFLNWFVHWGT